MSFPSDTIAALATPVGTAAIALVRASGPECAALVAAIFGESPAPRYVKHADYRDRDGALVDDVLFTFFAAPNSYTGEDSLEISSHGNPFIAQKILEDLCARGCRPAEPGEFTQRAFLNGRMDLSQAEAVMDVIHARSEKALAVAHQQLRGALGRRLTVLMDGLLQVLARVEAYIDFPDEDLPPEDRDLVRREIDRILSETGNLLATSHYGEMLRDGIKTVIVGEPNAGKSSLLNRLVGYDRALVSPEPGTTRDFLEERILVGPHGLRLIDTAGLNPTPAALEKLGIDKTMERVAEADLFVIVLDGSRPRPPLAPELAQRMNPQNTVMLLNKSDLTLHTGAVAAEWAGFETLSVSALTGAGFDELKATLARRADAFQTTTGDDMIAINARHARALDLARQSLSEARTKLAGHAPSELLASDLRSAWSALAEISGKVDNEQMLDRLFASFCIGK